MSRFKVPDMSCAHCVRTIEEAIRSIDSAADVSCDLATKEVRVRTALPPERIAGALATAGYENERMTDA